MRRFLYGALGLCIGLSASWVGAQPDWWELKRFADEKRLHNPERRAWVRDRARRLGLPERRRLAGGATVQLKDFVGKHPIYYLADNVNAADTVSTDEIQPGGRLGLNLDGSGETLGIWDAGSVRATHQELSGRVTNLDAASAHNHATHVAGTLIGSGVQAAARGMAFAGQLRAYDWSDDTTEMATEQLGPDPILVSNHSYGVITGWIFGFFDDGKWVWFGNSAISEEEDWRFGYYGQSVAEWDNIAYNSPNYLPVVSAGNDRGEGPPAGTLHWQFDSRSGLPFETTDTPPVDGGSSGFDTVSGSSVAKNVLAIGAVYDIPGGYNAPGDVASPGFSSWGPTDDGRIKPDIVANGVLLYSSLAGSDSAYGSYSGTSMSAPNTAGSIGLLNQYAKALYGGPVPASTVKALIVHGADEAGLAPGPDYRYGWGLLNTAAAADLMTQDTAPSSNGRIFEISLDEGSTEELVFESDSGSPFRVTAVWTDPPGTPVPVSLDTETPVLVNDIDLRVIDPNGVVHFPWILDPLNPADPASTGDNARDPVEQIHIAAPVPGTYRVQISHKGMLHNGAPQQVSTVVSGHLDLPPLAITTTSLPEATVGQAYTATLAASGGTPGYSWQVIDGALPPGVELLPDGTLTGTPTAEGDYGFTVEVSDQDGNTATESLSLSVVVYSPPVTTADLVISTDNGEEVYFNGQLIGGSNDWTQGSAYTLSLQQGLNVLAVRGSDAGGVAALIAQLDLSDGSVLVSDASWKVSTGAPAGWEQPGFDDSAWSAASSYGAYGVSPWLQRVSGMPPGTAAQWIWSADHDGDDLAYFRLVIAIGPIPLDVTTTSLAEATVDQAYTATLAASGGTPGYSWQVIDGALPPGVELLPDGTLTGTPTAEGDYGFTVEVSDQDGNTATESLSLSVVVYSPPAATADLVISTDNGEEVYFNGQLIGGSNDWTQGSAYTLSLQQGLNVLAVRGSDAGGVAALIAQLDLSDGGVLVSDPSWKVSTGAPAGWEQPGFDDSAWSAASSYGAYGVSPWLQRVSGMPPGTAAQWIWSADHDGDDLAYFRLVIAIGPIPLDVTTTSLAEATVDQAYTATLAASGGTPGYSWQVIDGALPPGVELLPDGTLTGTPTAEGDYGFTVEVSDQDGNTATESLSLSVVVYSPPAATADLVISTDNGEEVYFNGQLIGGSNDWTQGSAYTLSLQQGLNVLAVRGSDAGGVAALIAQLDLSDGGVLVSDPSWKVSTGAPAGWEQPGFDDSAWSAASSYGAYGVSPWLQRVSGMPPGTAAQWIWSADHDGDDLAYFRLVIAIGPIPLDVTTTSLAEATVDQAYTATLAASGGTPGYSWQVIDGALPPGVELLPDGTLTGTPAVEGDYGFTVEVSDQDGNTATESLSLSVVVYSPPAATADLVISTDNGEEVYFNGQLIGGSNDWTQGSAYTLSLQQGLNVLAVRGSDAGGVAALIAQLDLSDGSVLVSDPSWKVSTGAPAGWEQPGFDDSAWSAASSYGAYGVSPWLQRVSGMPPGTAAQWIWSADNSLHNEVYLRYSIIR